MRKVSLLILVFLISGLVVTSGCMGGSNGSSTTSSHKSSTSPTTTTESSSAISPTASSTISETTTTQHTTTHTVTSGTTITTTESSPSSTTTTSSGSTVTTSTITHSSTTTISSSPTTTTTTATTSTTTTTATPAEKAYWSNPWSYAPVAIDGKTYWITYYKYRCKVQPNQSAPVYEYEVEKWLGKENVHVYGMDMMGNKVDVGEHEVYAYKTKITPINAKSITGPITITVWSTALLNDTFIYPWNILWMSSMSPYGGNSTFVGFKIEYNGAEALVTNPSAFRQGLFPYISDESHVLSQISDDLGNVYLGWVATIDMGFWYEWSRVNLLQPQSGTWDDMQGHTITWSTSPDGTVEYGGHDFILVDYSWSYTGASENVSLSGSGKFSPYLPLLVEGDGHYSYKEKSGETTVIYAYLKLEDIGLGDERP